MKKLKNNFPPFFVWSHSYNIQYCRYLIKILENKLKCLVFNLFHFLVSLFFTETVRSQKLF